jgi:5-methyltetrahydropteroyltriglutamate--homocysteine methyltransferase
MNATYRAEQVGSLLRPQEVLDRRGGDPEQLKEAEDGAIADAFRRQRDVGLDIFTDGEIRRGSWVTDMAEAVDGFVSAKVMLEWKGPGGGTEASTANAVGSELRKRRKLTEYELPFLKERAPGPFKVTLPAPSNFMVASYKPGVTDKVYKSPADLLDAIVEIVRDEIRWLVSEGVSYIQFDAPYYSHYLDPAQRERMQREGWDPDQELLTGITGDNAALQDVPRDRVTLALHVCRGNSRSRWYTEGGYDVIAEQLFQMLNVDRFLLEYDTERSGGFQPLRMVPRGKTVVLGLVTTKDPRLESKDALRRRIDEAAKYVPIENLALSPQCGFASVAAGNLLTMDDQWRKLELVAETARKVW